MAGPLPRSPLVISLPDVAKLTAGITGQVQASLALVHAGSWTIAGACVLYCWGTCVLGHVLFLLQDGQMPTCPGATPYLKLRSLFKWQLDRLTTGH